MIPRLSPAEIRTGERLRLIYGVAAAHILAEEQAADAAALPSGADLVGARFAELTATPDGRARFAMYLDRLEITHGRDRAMRHFIDERRAHLATYPDGPGHPGSAPDGDPATVPDGPDHTPPADITTTPHASWLDRTPQVAEATEGATP